MDRLQEISQKYDIDTISNDGKLLNVSLEDIGWLIIQAKYREKNIKELSDRVRKQQKVIEELNKYNEALILENMELKKITLKNGVKFQATR